MKIIQLEADLFPVIESVSNLGGNENGVSGEPGLLFNPSWCSNSSKILFVTPEIFLF